MNRTRILGMMLGVAVAVSLAACTNPSEATRVLESQGFTDIKITGYQIWGCGKEDFDHTGFTANGPTGKPVTGIVCGGPFKGSTIRFN